jgi:hypothetical protein
MLHLISMVVSQRRRFYNRLQALLENSNLLPIKRVVFYSMLQNSVLVLSGGFRKTASEVSKTDLFLRCKTREYMERV